MPARRLTGAGRREALRKDDVEATPAERRRRRELDDAAAEVARSLDVDPAAGRGRPLSFDDGLAIQDPLWLVNHVLKNSGYVPPFAELGRRVDEARRATARAEEAWREAPDDSARAARAEALEAAWADENRLIRHWNREAPSPTLQRYPMPAERRWARLRAAAGSAPGGPAER